MKRYDIEIMAPVGSYESLAAAIRAGADAVYFGVGKLNMRSASAANFTLDDLGRIVASARKAGVKTYLTVNTIVYEDEIADVHAVIDRAKIGLAKYAEAGELASVGKPLFKVGEVDRMYLRAYVTSEQLSQVKLGDKVTVYSDYGNSEQKAYPGVVTWISDRSEFTPKTILTKNERANLVYAVKIAVKNDGSLKIGMYGGVVWKKENP